MKRHFGLPVTFAAALHGALLFGIPGGPRTPVESKSTETSRFEVPLTVREDPPEEVASLSPVSERQTPQTRSEVSAPEPQASRPHVTVGVSIPTVVLATPTLAPTSGILPRGGGFADRGGVGGPIDGVLLDNPPRTRLQVAPIFPHAARREGLNGEVVVEFEVNETGSVQSPRLVSSTAAVFEEPALRALERWKFEPGRKHGRIVRFRMAVPIRFTIDP